MDVRMQRIDGHLQMGPDDRRDGRITVEMVKRLCHVGKRKLPSLDAIAVRRRKWQRFRFKTHAFPPGV